MRINKDTPLVMLTIGQLPEILRILGISPDRTPEIMRILGISPDRTSETATEDKPKKYVYGLAGIRKLFNVSHATAQRYKDTIIADAVSQQGKIIVTDVDKAMELFNKKKGGRK